MLDDLKFEIQPDPTPSTRIKVIGVGGGGTNAVARMVRQGLPGIEFYALNTDVQSLNAAPVPNKLAIGTKITNGLGAGADPSIGRQAALEDTERIIEILEGADMVFVTAGLGGGTGTGAAPVVASLAKELGALTVAVVTKSFDFEGPRRRRAADRGLTELASAVDTVISLPNDKLLSLVPRGTSFYEAFRIADDVLRQAVQGISDIITTPGLINRDFSDIRAIMHGMGHAMMGSASARGPKAAIEAARAAIESPMLEDGGVSGAKGILINVTASSSLGLHELNEACQLIREAAANDDVQINFGVVLDESLDDEVRVTVIATGFEHTGLPAIERPRVTVEVPLVAEVPVATETQMPLPEPPVAPIPAIENLAVEESAPPAARVPEPEPMHEEPVRDDIETPAFLRRRGVFAGSR